MARSQPRRTQAQRTEETRAILLDAALEALERHGYAGASVMEIVKIAGVSSGALMHHFPSKKALMAEAIAVRQTQKAEATAARLAGAPPSARSFMTAHLEHYAVGFYGILEFFLAMRTDAELKALFFDAVRIHHGPVTETYAALTPEFQGTPAQSRMGYVLGCFLRGLMVERVLNDEALADETFELFTKMVESYARHQMEDLAAGQTSVGPD